MLNYTIAYDKEGLRAKDWLEKAEKDGEGKIGRFICMGLYYALQIFAISFIAMFAKSALGALLKNVIVAMILLVAAYVIIAVFSLIYSIMSIASCNEFYKINVLGEHEEENIVF